MLLAGNLAAAAQEKISIADFMPVIGQWKGTLTYLDYSSNQQTMIPANTMLERIGDSVFDQYVYYSDEPDKNNKTRYKISGDGTRLDDMKLVERTRLPDGALKLVLESKGQDGNDHRPATFRRIYILSAHVFTITKMVRMDGETDFFQRHQYAFSR